MKDPLAEKSMTFLGLIVLSRLHEAYYRPQPAHGTTSNCSNICVWIVFKLIIKQGKKSANQQRSDVLICYCFLASRRSDKVKWLPPPGQLHWWIVNSGGPL